MTQRTLRARQRVGQYRVEGQIAVGGFAEVYRAFDTVEGIRVALKIPHAHLVDKETLALFRSEVRLTAKLDHPNILPIKTAGFIDDKFIIVCPLGTQSLEERLSKRIGVKTALEWTEQLLSALAYAHSQRIIHCDVKPENILLFDRGRLRLADFGIAKVAYKTLRAEGTGTVGYVAPEQAMGQPSLRSDVFSAGLLLHRLFSRKLPEWPFEWPFPGHDRLRASLHPDLIEFLRRSCELHEQKRFESAEQMFRAFQRLKSRGALLAPAVRKRKGARRSSGTDWKAVRWRQFKSQLGKALETKHHCTKCKGPVSEIMRFCPWCQHERKVHRELVRFPARCTRCKRGVKLDWRFCAWCYGGLIGPASEREYRDRRYSERCSNRSCERKELMPHMRYCPWCRTKVKQPSAVPGSNQRCRQCKSGMAAEYWEFCPSCSLPRAR